MALTRVPYPATREEVSATNRALPLANAAFKLTRPDQSCLNRPGVLFPITTRARTLYYLDYQATPRGVCGGIGDFIAEIVKVTAPYCRQ